MRPCGAETCLEGRAGSSFEGQPVGVGAFVGQARHSRVCSVAHEVRVELASDIAFQDAHDLADGFAFGDAARDVFAGAFIAAHAGEHDPPQGMVRLAVPAGVESMPVDLP